MCLPVPIQQQVTFRWTRDSDTPREAWTAHKSHIQGWTNMASYGRTGAGEGGPLNLLCAKRRSRLTCFTSVLIFRLSGLVHVKDSAQEEGTVFMRSLGAQDFPRVRERRDFCLVPLQMEGVPVHLLVPGQNTQLSIYGCTVHFWTLAAFLLS
jgi:hypothetical protein